jgi:hypothetical protein
MRPSGDESNKILGFSGEANKTVSSLPEWRSQYFHLMVRRGQNIVKAAMARRLVIRTYWMWRQNLEYQQGSDCTMSWRNNFRYSRSLHFIGSPDCEQAGHRSQQRSRAIEADLKEIGTRKVDLRPQ